MTGYSHSSPQIKGIDQVNDFTQSQLGQGGYQVVLAVYNSLNTLSALANSLPMIDSVAKSSMQLTGLQNNIGAINAVNTNLMALVNLNQNLPAVMELAPQIASFNSQMEELSQSIHQNNVRTEKLKSEIEDYIHRIKNTMREYDQKLEKKHTKALDDLDKHQANTLKKVNEKLKQMSKYHKDLERYIPIVEKAIDQNAYMHKQLAHLLASEAVTNVSYTLSQEDYLKAIEAIKHSESLDNKECILREKLEKYIKGEVNFMTTINSTNAELIRSQGGDTVDNTTTTSNSECADCGTPQPTTETMPPVI